MYDEWNSNKKDNDILTIENIQYYLKTTHTHTYINLTCYYVVENLNMLHIIRHL